MSLENGAKECILWISARAFQRIFTFKIWLRYSRERALSSLPDPSQCSSGRPRLRGRARVPPVPLRRHVARVAGAALPAARAAAEVRDHDLGCEIHAGSNLA